MSRATLKIGTDPSTGLASSPAPPKASDFQFERPEWTLFRSVDTLSQKAGVSRRSLRRLVLKELVDNALDSRASVVTIDPLAADTYSVSDDGRGIAGEPDDIARLFSINRPLMSSKLWRLPSRGAMGNGLRVVVGAVAASDGALVVVTNNRRMVLQPREDGFTAVVEVEPVEHPVGTTVEITFGSTIPADSAATVWADAAIRMAEGGDSYTGRPSPWWYDADAFFELLRSAGARPVREFIERLDGCTGAKAGKIASTFRATACNALTRPQTYALLHAARAEAKPVRPQRLGAVGQASWLPRAYSRQLGEVEIGGREPKARIPFAIEAWAVARPRQAAGREDAGLDVYVNRTPVAATVRAYCSKKEFDIYGCGLRNSFDVPAGSFDVILNITTPWCPITTDGKEPDLSYFLAGIEDAVRSATRKAKSAAPKLPSAVSEGQTHKAVAIRHLPEGVAKASGGGEYRFNQRQLFYVMRPIVLAALGAELTWGNFCTIITDYEAEHDEIAGMYRDPRGTLYHPHLRQDITLGTLAVEDYERPAWTFGQILYIEKEGFFEALKAARWPERHDCALVTSKGFTTRAVRDLLDLLGDGDEPIRVFCVHDADAFGTMIFQTLREETKARARRRVEAVNLGLDPWEALDMGLAPETVKDGERRKAVADYVLDREDGQGWTDWLQDTRVELNEMTTPQFIAWLDGKMEGHGVGKVIPPEPVIAEAAAGRLTSHVRAIVTERVLREAGVEDQVAEAVAGLVIPSPDALVEHVAEWLQNHDADAWTVAVDQAVAEVAETVR